MRKQIVNNLAYEIVGCCIEVHKELGPGLYEAIYEEALYYELQSKHIYVERQKEIIVPYKEVILAKKYRLDLIVENLIIVELKAVKNFQPIDTTQILSHMKLAKVPKGLLINFNVTNLYKEGHKSFVNEFYRNLDD